MKKIVILAFLSLALMTSCEEDLVIYDVDNGQSLSALASDSGTLPVPAEGSTFSLPVEVSTRSTADRAISVSVDPSSTALPAEYTIDNSSLVIPAGEFNGTILISGNFEEIPDLTTTTLVLNLDSVEGAVVAEGDSSFTLSMFKQCPSDLAGTYVVVSSGQSTDGAPVNNPLVDFSYTVEITKVDGTDLDYVISDGVAGVYQDWYCAPYGYCFETEGNFQDVCDSLSGSWVEAFGSTVSLTGSVNPDGTLTISWENGFGDTATGVYTKQ
jgi:hypothetical protein